MAVVPIAAPTQRLDPLPGGGLQAANFTQGTEAIAHGLEQLGGQIGNYAEVRNQIASQQAETEAKAADVAYGSAINQTLDGEDGLRTKREKAAVEGFGPTLTALEKSKTELETRLSPRARKLFLPVAAQRMQDAIDRATRHVATENRDWVDNTSKARIALASSDAAGAYLDPQVAEKNVNTAIEEVGALAARNGWSEEEAAYEKLKVTSNIRRDIAGRLADVDPHLGEKYVDQFKGQMTSDDQDHALDLVRSRYAAVEAEKRRAESEYRQQHREEVALLGEQGRDVLDMIDKGFTVPHQSVAKLADRLDAEGKPVLALRLRTGAKVQDFTAEAQSWRPDQLQGWINTERAKTKGTADPVQFARLQAGEKLLGDMSAGLKADPLSWAAKAYTARIDPFDLRRPETVTNRINTALAVAQHYGIPPKFLTDEETTAWAQRIASFKPVEKVEIAGAIVSGFGRYGRDVLGSVSSADPVFAHAAALSTLGPSGKQTALRIFTGQEVLKDKAVAMPSVDRFAQADGVGRAMAFTPRARGATLDAARAIYAADAVAAHLDPTRVDPDVWEKAVNRAAGASYLQDGTHVGGIGRYRGVDIVLPHNITTDDFRTLIGRLTDRDINPTGKPTQPGAPVYGNGKLATAADIQGGYLFDAGEGRYFVSLDKAGTQFLRAPGGKHFVLDFGALAPRLRGRVSR